MYRCNDWCYITDRAYSKEELLRMEGCILATLDFRQTTRSDRLPLPQTGNLRLWLAGSLRHTALAPDSRTMQGPAHSAPPVLRPG